MGYVVINFLRQKFIKVCSSQFNFLLFNFFFQAYISVFTNQLQLLSRKQRRWKEEKKVIVLQKIYKSLVFGRIPLFPLKRIILLAQPQDIPLKFAKYLLFLPKFCGVSENTEEKSISNKVI